MWEYILLTDLDNDYILNKRNPYKKDAFIYIK